MDQPVGFPVLELVGLESVFVHVDAEAGFGGHRVHGAFQFDLMGEDVFVGAAIVAQHLCFGFQPREVGDGCAKVNRRRCTDRPQRVVRHQVNVVRFCPASYFHRLREAAHVADVDPSEVGQALLDIGQELPLAGELLADREGHRCHLSEGGVSFRALVSDGLLEEVQRRWRHHLAKRRSFGDAQAMVVVDAENHLSADLLPELGQPLGCHGDGLSRLEQRGVAARVWMVSPTTLWAILNTVMTVLKDAATREQVHIIQEHLGYLGKDFARFQKRMDDLARHIKLAHEDVDNVNRSAKKISSRFEKIERVELENDKHVTVNTTSLDDPENLS